MPSKGSLIEFLMNTMSPGTKSTLETSTAELPLIQCILTLIVRHLKYLTVQLHNLPEVDTDRDHRDEQDDTGVVYILLVVPQYDTVDYEKEKRLEDFSHKQQRTSWGRDHHNALSVAFSEVVHICGLISHYGVGLEDSPNSGKIVVRHRSEASFGSVEEIFHEPVDEVGSLVHSHVASVDNPDFSVKLW